MLSYPKLHTGIPTIDQTWEKLIYTLQQFVQGAQASLHVADDVSAHSDSCFFSRV